MTRTEPPLFELEDRFHLHEQIARGGFSTVWRADDTEGDLPVAVKVPNHDSNQPETVRAHFNDEYRIISAFESAVMPTSIVRFIAGSLQEPQYIVTEFVNGPTLESAVEAGTIESGPENIRTIGLPIARAIEFLHYNGYLYLDCKPQNILIRTRDGSPVLVDFNAAARIDKQREVRFLEDGYKAPEQTPEGTERETIGTRADVFGLGKLLAYLLVGRTIPTFRSSDGIDPRESGGSCSEAVAEIIIRATRRNPTERYANAIELVTVLLEALDEPTQAVSLRHDETDLTCLIRHGDTVGQISQQEALPSISIPGATATAPSHPQVWHQGPRSS